MNGPSVSTARNWPRSRARPKQACLDALRAIEVEATPLPFVVKEETAKNPDAPRVWPDAPNLGEANVKEKGDVDKAFAEAAAVVEGFFTTPVQLHQPLETHGNTVSATDDGVTCWASTQGIFSVREGLASYLDVPQEKVRVITEYMGGGFGAKFGPGTEGGLAARLSQAAGAPVKLMLTRFDQSLAVGNRPSSFQRIRAGSGRGRQARRVRHGCVWHGGHRRGHEFGGRRRRRWFSRAVHLHGSQHSRETGPCGRQRGPGPRVPRAGASRRLVRHGIDHGRAGGEVEDGPGGASLEERPEQDSPEGIRHRRGAVRVEAEIQAAGLFAGPRQGGRRLRGRDMGRRRTRLAGRSADQPGWQRRGSVRHAGSWGRARARSWRSSRRKFSGSSRSKSP